MRATDELRRLLDERGIEHDDEFVKSVIPYCDGYEATYWGGGSFGYVEPIRPKPNTIGSHPELTINDCTPEQAIAATLGSGECEWLLEHSGTLYDKWRCSKCGYLHVESRTDGGATDLDPNFCPNCGKAVKR